MINIFNNNAFSSFELSEAIKHREYVPTYFDKSGLFTDKFIRTEDIGIEFGVSGLKLVQTSNRGDPLEQLGKRKRNIRKYSTVRVGMESTIYASEINFIRQMGKEEATIAVADEIADRLGLGGTIGLLDNIDATMERLRLGAIQGKVVDVDGTVLWDWADEFQSASSMGGAGTIGTVPWNLNPASEGDFRVQANVVRRGIQKAAGSASVTKIINYCGHEFFDAVTKIPEVRKVYANAEKAYYLQGGDQFDSFEYPANVVWVDYRGTDDDSSIKIKDDECHTVPKGADGAFMNVYAHGETLDDLGTKGNRYYADIIMENRPKPRFVKLEATTYPLIVCKVPHLLRKGTIV